MIVRNDNITEATIAGIPAFTPASFRNLGEWWSTSYGVQLSGTDVDSWVGINGNVFTPNNASYKAIYDSADVDFNGLASISINPNGSDVGYTASVVSGSTNKTIIMISKMLTTSNENGILYMDNYVPTSYRVAILSNTTVPKLYTDGTPGLVYQTIDGATDVSGDYLVTMVQYTKSLGTINAFASNTSSLPSIPGYVATGRSANLTFDRVAFGYYFNVVASAKFKLTDYIVINGIPLDEEIASLNAYVANTYGF